MSSAAQQSRHGGERTVENSRLVSESIARSDAAMSQHRRNDGQFTAAPRRPPRPAPLTRSESWVEIASQPSSSSLSSIGDEIVTTGLRVGAGASSYPPRRRRLHQPHVPPSYIVSQSAAAHAGTSSQDEYDETESEEDRLMTSSTENMQGRPSLLHQQTAVGAEPADSDSDDDDENATALGRPSQSPVFRPQPNAFSHPPSHLSQRSHSTSSAIPHHPPYGRPSMSQRAQTRVHRNHPNFMSPSYQADNDAALRASLTTLLSCAAAARGLPKSKEDTIAGPSSNPLNGTGVGPSSQPMEFRLVDESELMAEGPARVPAPSKLAPPRVSQQSRTASNSSAPSGPASASSRGDKSKRTAATQSKPARATKKKKTAAGAAVIDGETATFLSPTLLSWVVSAGVVVLVSVVGFGAGYVIGREVGRQDAGLGMGGASAGAGTNATSCGGDLVKSTSGGTLRRFRWGSAVGRSVAA